LGGEDLELLTTKQLEGLENQLQIGVKRIRHIKVNKTRCFLNIYIFVSYVIK